MVQNIISRIKLNDTFQKVDLKNNSDFYLIAIKGDKTPKDTIDVDTIRKVRFEFAIDSGVKNKPLTILYQSLDFSDMTSGKNDINKITAFCRLNNLPKQFYIKIISVDDGYKEITSGELPIHININIME